VLTGPEFSSPGEPPAGEDTQYGAKPIQGEVPVPSAPTGGKPASKAPPSISSRLAEWLALREPVGRELIVQSMDRLEEAQPGDVQAIAASQIRLLDGYHSQVLSQAARSFRWALIAAGVGLAFYLAAVVFVVVDQPPRVATISLISGALIEVISGINFYLYARTSAQLAQFHSRSDVTQRFVLANSLCETLDQDSKSRERSALIRRIAGIGLEEKPGGVVQSSRRRSSAGETTNDLKR
jgi:hypothetical protein